MQCVCRLHYAYKSASSKLDRSPSHAAPTVLTCSTDSADPSQLGQQNSPSSAQLSQHTQAQVRSTPVSGPLRLPWVASAANALLTVNVHCSCSRVVSACQQLCTAGATHRRGVEVCKLHALAHQCVHVGCGDELVHTTRRVVHPDVIIPVVQVTTEQGSTEHGQVVMGHVCLISEVPPGLPTACHQPIHMALSF